MPVFSSKKQNKKRAAASKRHSLFRAVKKKKTRSVSAAVMHQNRSSWKNVAYNRPEKPQNNRRKYIVIAILVITILANVWVLLFHDFFQIKTVRIEGTERISSEEVRDHILGAIDYKRWFLLPGKNYFLVDVKELVDILHERYSLKTVTITKSFPKYLDVVINEKLSAVMYDNGHTYSLIDQEGSVIEELRKVGEHEWLLDKKMVSSTNDFGEEVRKELVSAISHHPDTKQLKGEYGNYPIVYYPDKTVLDVATSTGMVFLQEEEVKEVLFWFEHLEQTKTLPIQYISYIPATQSAEFKLRNGKSMFIALTNKKRAIQVLALDEVLTETVNLDEVNYLDIRYGNRIFWQ